MNTLLNAGRGVPSAPLLTEEQLNTQFRQTMRLPANEAGELRLRGELQTLMEELLCRDLKQDTRAQSMLLGCRLRLRLLQNMIAAERKEDNFISLHCDLRTWLADLCAAADMLLHPLGCPVVFDALEQRIEAACAPREIALLLLELICNGIRHGEWPATGEQPATGEKIHVAMTLNRAKKHNRPATCTIAVTSPGALDLQRLHISGQRAGSGAAAMQHTAYLHAGSMIWLNRNGHTIASLRLPLRPYAGLPLAETPDFTELLSDQLSPVYTALSPVALMG